MVRGSIFRHQAWRRSGGRWNCRREMSAKFCLNADLHAKFRDLFTCRKATTWDRRLYFPSEGRCAEDFFRYKNMAASAGCEPANLGTKGQHANSSPPKPLNKIWYYVRKSWPGSSVGIATNYGLDVPMIESRWERDFPPVQTGPEVYPASCTIGTGFLPWVKCGRGVTLTTHPLLVPRSLKSRAISFPPSGPQPSL